MILMFKDCVGSFMGRIKQRSFMRGSNSNSGGDTCTSRVRPEMDESNFGRNMAQTSVWEGKTDMARTIILPISMASQAYRTEFSLPVSPTTPTKAAQAQEHSSTMDLNASIVEFRSFPEDVGSAISQPNPDQTESPSMSRREQPPSQLQNIETWFGGM